MSSDTSASVTSFARRLHRLRDDREKRKSTIKAARRQNRGHLSKAQRAKVLRKTGGRCHICGGRIAGKDWQADHVLAHDRGGGSSVDNFLPAHAVCNNYRWDYSPREFQEILRLGVWLRTQIEKRTSVGDDVAPRYIAYEQRRIGRRKKRSSPPRTNPR